MFFFPVDNKDAVKNFMPAMFRIDLGKAKDFTVGELPPESFAQVLQILYFLRA